MPRLPRISIDGASLTPDSVVAVARRAATARLARGLTERLRAARAVVDAALRSGATVYGVNTGFGHLATVRIEKAELRELQVNLVRSHAAGVGPLADDATVRALLVLRANVLARAHSGVRPVVVRQLIAMLEHDILPLVPEQGSVGASGDLAPLAHVALASIGEGRVRYGGREMPAARALDRAGLAPLQLEAKEGLSLVNGTQFSAAIACLALDRAERLLRTADVSCALVLEALKGSRRAFDERLHEARPHPGQLVAAANLRRLTEDSEIEASHADCPRVQDAYSLRCAPQVHGAARDAVAELRRVLSIEINASTDNPMVFPDTAGVLSGGNFHGAPVAMASDYAALALAGLAQIVERRTDRVVNPLLSGLPAFLATRPGLESGLMMAQVTSAALASECKGLAHPGSVDSIPTSASQEDHVSMSPWCARKLREIVERVEVLVAIELLAGLRGITHHRPLRSSRALESVAARLSREVPLPSGDAPPAPVIAALAQAVRDGVVLEAAREGGATLA
jgi:histidine ammonia-lyase